jgi:hypothetical protein
MQTNAPFLSSQARMGLVFGVGVLRTALDPSSLGGSGLLSLLAGCLLVLGYLHWCDRSGPGGVSPERLSQTGPTPLDRQAVPTLLTIAIGLIMFLGPFFGMIVGFFYFKAAFDPKRRKDGQAIVLKDLLPLLFAAGNDRTQATKILAAFEARVGNAATAATPSEPAPQAKAAPKPKAKAAPSATERLVPPATWGTVEPKAHTRTDWFNEPPAEPAMTRTEPTPGLAAGEVAPFHVASASALGDWSLGTSSTIVTSSVQAVSYDQSPYTPLSAHDDHRSDRAPSGFDEALALLQARPEDKRRD